MLSVVDFAPPGQNGVAAAANGLQAKNIYSLALDRKGLPARGLLEGVGQP